MPKSAQYSVHIPVKFYTKWFAV